MPESKLLTDLIARRWSPRAFQSKPIEPEKLRSLFEAARWAASCFNEQPWRFVVTTQGHPEQFERVLGTLMPKNREWAKNAWVLGISAGKKTFTHNGAPDRFGLHDAGAALANLMIEATAVGLHVHGMGGFDADKARTEFGIPEDFEVGAAFAIGYIEGSPNLRPTESGARWKSWYSGQSGEGHRPTLASESVEKYEAHLCRWASIRP